jgi:Telomere resolvase
MQNYLQCINNPDPYTVAIGITGLTERRTIEILKTGHFEHIDKNTLLFSGQAKTKNSPNTHSNYPAPYLTHPKKTLKTAELLRKKTHSLFLAMTLSKKYTGEPSSLVLRKLSIT